LVAVLALDARHLRDREHEDEVDEQLDRSYPLLALLPVSDLDNVTREA
jgi:hypothetical protein